MIVTVLGARGSTPATGSEFAKYGGDTSSVAIAANTNEAPRLVLDAGTGIRRLANLTEAFQGTILLTHLHWDHTHGLPFCRAIDNPDAKVRVLLPKQDGDPLDVLGRAMGPPHFPITPDRLEGNWNFDWIEPGVVEVEGFVVETSEVRHKGGSTNGYRVNLGSRSVTYVPDHSYDPGAARSVIRLASGTDLLLHDAQDVDTEWPAAAKYGHSTATQANLIAKEAGVGQLALFHHSFRRTDDEVDAIVDSFDADVVGAAAGEAFYL